MALTKVSTDGVKDDAITSGKIPANAVGASELADNAVDTNAIANNAVTAGKTSGVQTTINNNADNRVITGSGTANTLNGESALTFDGSTLDINGGTTDTPLLLDTTNSSGSHLRFRKDGANKHFLGCGGGFGLGDVDDLSLRTTDNIIFGVGTSEKMRMNSSGNVGIGTTSPDSKLSLTGTGSDAATRLSITDGSGKANVLGRYGNLSLQADETNAVAGSLIQFKVDGSEKLRIQAGGGISFNGDTAAANALDDYEEGTWTPSVTGGTITNSGAYYTKIGRVVHWYLYGYVSNTANDGNQFRIYGLPFTVGGNSTGLQNYYGNVATFNYTASANNSGLGVLTPLAHGASTYIYFHFIGVGDPNPPVNSYWHSHMLNQSFIISGVYFV